MRNIEVKLPWVPKAKERPRSTRTGHTYTPAATRKAEALLASAFREEVGELWTPYDSPLSVEMEFWNDHVVLRIEEVEAYTQRKLRGDTDNYMKTVGDALNGVAWEDDRLITTIKGAKR